MMEKVVVNVARTETGYCAGCDLLPGWIVTYEDDWKDFQAYVQESIDFYVECARQDGDRYSAIFDGEYEVEYLFDIQSLLCYYQSIFSFAALQHLTGINQKQLCHYASGRSKPRLAQKKKIIDGLHKLADDLHRVSV